VVLPGLPLTRATDRPTRLFSRLDFPTLLLPMNATSGSSGLKKTRGSGNDPTKSI
jgi:hypothetical protein